MSITKNSGSAPGAARKILQTGHKVTKQGTVCKAAELMLMLVRTRIVLQQL